MVGAALAWHRPQLVRVPEAYPLCVFWRGVFLFTVPRERCHRPGTLYLSLQPWLALLSPVLVWPAARGTHPLVGLQVPDAGEGLGVLW